MKNKLIAGTGIIILILLAGFFYNKFRVAPKIKFESLELTDLKGNYFSPDSFKNKKLFINFFATWCGACLKELPSMEKAQYILAKENFQFILISDEPVSVLQSFEKQTGARIVILHLEKQLREQKIFTLPTTYVLNSDREIVFSKVGETDWTDENLMDKLKRLSK